MANFFSDYSSSFVNQSSVTTQAISDLTKMKNSVANMTLPEAYQPYQENMINVLQNSIEIISSNAGGVNPETLTNLTLDQVFLNFSDLSKDPNDLPTIFSAQRIDPNEINISIKNNGQTDINQDFNFKPGQAQGSLKDLCNDVKNSLEGSVKDLLISSDVSKVLCFDGLVSFSCALMGKFLIDLLSIAANQQKLSIS